MVRSTNFLLKLNIKTWLFALSILFLIPLLLTISSFNIKYYTFSTTKSPSNSDIKTLISSTMTKIERELHHHLSMHNSDKQALHLTTFLIDILNHMRAIQALLPHMDNSPQQIGLQVGSHGKVGEFFLVEEIRKYMKMKPNRLGKKNFMGANGSFASVGHGCFEMKEELEEYMDYDVGDICKDDWKLGQKLMVHGCDPLPRRRCFSTSPKYYMRPYGVPEAAWRLPDDKNVRWSHYKCKNFACLAKNSTGKGFFKCSDCFNLTHHEKPRWVEPLPLPLNSTNSTSPEFLIKEVISIKPDGELRIGFDFSVGTGTFATRMREYNVTIVTATINFGAPFSEMIALRGLIPLYLTINQRLPFFDNTLDIVHTTRFLDGWMDLVLLDFVLYDWDRVLRPGGLLWIDSFFCMEKDVKGYLEAFEMLRYKKHKWVMVPKLDKDGQEVFFSAVLEKPLRPF